MINWEFRATDSCILNIDRGYTRNTAVRIIKGSRKGCEGKISGCSNGVYFVRLNEANAKKQPVNTHIDMFVQDEFELLS